MASTGAGLEVGHVTYSVSASSQTSLNVIRYILGGQAIDLPPPRPPAAVRKGVPLPAVYEPRYIIGGSPTSDNAADASHQGKYFEVVL